MPRRTLIVTLLAVFSVGLSSAWAFVITDPATTVRNAVTAIVKSRILDTLTEQHQRVLSMARRLSVSTNLDKYLVTDVPGWSVYRFQNVNLYANPYSEALNSGDPQGTAYDAIARERSATGPEVTELAEAAPMAHVAIAAGLATLDLADSANIAWTDQNGQLRVNGTGHMRVIDALERDVLDLSTTQSATALLDKISAATFIETRQKEARMQFLTGIVEQLLVDNKRARDTEAAVLNMQLGRLRDGGDAGGGGFLTRAGDDLRTWRQP